MTFGIGTIIGTSLLFILVQIFLEGLSTGRYVGKAHLANAMENCRCTSRKRTQFGGHAKRGRDQLGLDLVVVGEMHTCSAHVTAYGTLARKCYLKVSTTGT